MLIHCQRWFNPFKGPQKPLNWIGKGTSLSDLCTVHINVVALVKANVLLHEEQAQAPQFDWDLSMIKHKNRPFLDNLKEQSLIF